LSDIRSGTHLRLDP